MEKMTSEHEDEEKMANKAANLGPHGLGDPDDTSEVSQRVNRKLSP